MVFIPQRLRLAGVILARDTINLVRYGRGGPRWALQIWIDPGACSGWVRGFPPEHSGRVVDGDWDRQVLPITAHPDVAAATKHWRDGVSWERLGVHERLTRRVAEHGGERDHCRTAADIVRRFERLDLMFEQIRREGQLRPASDVSWGGRERDGVLMHIGRAGTPLFGGRGCHRLAAATVVGLKLIPAQLGVVHPQGVRHLVHHRRPVGAGGGARP